MVAAAAMLLIVVMMVMLVVMMAAAAMLFIVVMMVMLLLHFLKLCLHRGLALHSLQQLRAGKLIPGCGNDGGIFIVLTEHCHSRIQLFLRNKICTRQNDGACGFHLIVIEFAKVLHINLYLGGICHSNGKAQRNILTGHLLGSCDHVGKLANAGRLDQNAVRMKFIDHLLQCLAKITHQAAANAAGVHLCNVNACVLQKAAVNADLTKFILDQHQFLALIGFLDHFLDKRGFTSAQKAGKNINFYHITHLL